MTILKSIGAIVAGFLTVVILSVGTDYILEALGVFPPASEQGLYVTWMLVLAFIYRSIYTVAGGYVTAMLAPANPLRHIIVLGVLGTLGGIVGVFVGWDLSSHWYPIALAVTAFPLIWLGGKIWKRRRGVQSNFS
ncbi:hypothetical protein H7X87_02025 [Acetobacteraceae bacterium]|nr:hypothetical protein [Candidatus Parcubacteria bacterium]